MDEPSQPAEFPVGESFARTLTEATQSLVCVLDREGRILLFNEACERATGFRRHELIGRDARDFVIPPEERDAFGEFLSTSGHRHAGPAGRSLAQQGRRPAAHRLVEQADGRTDGMPQSLVTTGIDLTDREAREDDDALEESRGQARAGQPAGHRAARPASRGHARRLRGEPRARVHGGLRGMRAGPARQRVDRRALRGRRHGDHRRSPQPRQHRRLPRRRAAAARGALGRRARPEDGSARARGRLGRLTGEMASAIFRVGYRSTAAVPIVVAGALWGAVAIASEDPLRPTARIASSPLRAGLARRRQRSGPRRPHRVARAPGPGRRRPAPQARAQPARRRAAALRLRRTQAAPGPGAAGLAPGGDGRAAGGCLARARHGPARAARDRARPAPGDPRRAGLLRALEALAEGLPMPVDIDATPGACPSTSRRPPTTSSPRR